MRCSWSEKHQMGKTWIQQLIPLSPLSLWLMYFFSSDDWTPDTGKDQSMEFKLNICQKVQKKELDIKYPEDVASWGKRNKGTSLGWVGLYRFRKASLWLLDWQVATVLTSYVFVFAAVHVSRKLSKTPVFRGMSVTCRKILVSPCLGDQVGLVEFTLSSFFFQHYQ